MEATNAKFRVGDMVHFTNDYGVYWGTFKVINIETDCSYSQSRIGYYLEGCETPWYAHKEQSLRLFTGSEQDIDLFKKHVELSQMYYSDEDNIRFGVFEHQSKLFGRPE